LTKKGTSKPPGRLFAAWLKKGVGTLAHNTKKEVQRSYRPGGSRSPFRVEKKGGSIKEKRQKTLPTGGTEGREGYLKGENSGSPLKNWGETKMRLQLGSAGYKKKKKTKS